MIEITSAKNPRIQNVIKLREKSSERKSKQIFIIEGIREVRLALENKYELIEIYKCLELFRHHDKEAQDLHGVNAEQFEVSKEVYQKIAVRGSTEGIIALAKMKKHDLSNFKLSKNPLILVAEKVEKPGNLGALLRTADAAGLDGVILCEPLFDLYNSNVIRSSIGCLFSLQVALCGSLEAIKWLGEKGIKTHAASPYSEESYVDKDFKNASAIIVGSEAEGLSENWMNKCDHQILIPMHGMSDSLNVSVSAAIIVFEAVRQRSV